MKDSFTTLTLFSFGKNWYWPLKQMAYAKKNFKQENGLEFVRVMGTGGGSGFSLKPDFSTYAILCVWKNRNSSNIFFKNHFMFNEYLKKSISTRHIELKAIKSHGLWDGLEPFKNQEIIEKKSTYPIAVITRATLNWKMLIQFWKSVPKISKAIKNARGVSFFKGIGELPFIQQATISIWKNNDYINNFAYKNIDHTSVIKKTRKNKWYKEDLFSRFLVISDLSNKFSK
ncbi:MAG: spheroidene monooxygenase [Flavobacteriaceae bacterium]|nr:spheroidene monooxygenase [Flavobacteriaceae bacterium]